MKIGIIYTAYNIAEYIEQSLEAWTIAKKNRLAGHEFVICAVSVPFSGFPAPSKFDDTIPLLHWHLEGGLIDYLITDPKNVPETIARGMALSYLKSQNCDIVWQVDADEFYTIKDIDLIIQAVSLNPWVDWFRLCLKNYIFDDKTYLVNPFMPPRIHRVSVKFHDALIHAKGFSADNDIVYGDKDSSATFNINQGELVSRTLPENLAWVKHLTWQNNQRSKDKINYQLQGRGWPACSFSWDDSQGGLIFNPNLPKPKIARD